MAVPIIKPNQQALYVTQSESYLSPWTDGGTTNLVKQIHRVNNIGAWGFTKNGQFLNQLGTYDPIGYGEPSNRTANLQFSYYLTDYYNESNLGFALADSGTSEHMLSHMFTPEGFPKNYFILTREDHRDANYSTSSGTKVHAFGDGVLTNYSVNAAINNFPTANVQVECLNYLVDDFNAGDWVTNPCTYEGRSEDLFFLPNPQPNHSVSQPKVLHPGDISINISNDFLGISKKTILVQSFNFNLPLPRRAYYKFGKRNPESRTVVRPATYSCSLEFYVRDLVTGNLASESFCATTGYDIDLLFKNCSGESKLAYSFRNLFLESIDNAQEGNTRQRTTVNFISQFGEDNNLDYGAYLFSGFNFAALDRASYDIYTGQHTGDSLSRIDVIDDITEATYYLKNTTGSLFSYGTSGNMLEINYPIPSGASGDYMYAMMVAGNPSFYPIDGVEQISAAVLSGKNTVDIVFSGIYTNTPSVVTTLQNIDDTFFSFYFSGTNLTGTTLVLSDNAETVHSVLVLVSQDNKRSTRKKLIKDSYIQNVLHGSLFTGDIPIVFSSLENSDGEPFLTAFPSQVTNKYSKFYFSTAIPSNNYYLNIFTL